MTFKYTESWLRHPAASLFLIPFAACALYDLVCTLYYPDLSKKMAMKIGGEYLLDGILPRHFDKLAEETGLAKPLVKKRVPELAATVIGRLGAIEINQPDLERVAAIIGERSERVISDFAN